MDNLSVGALGECMLEMHESGEGQYQLGYGGDVFNTAVYLQRQGVSAGFITATGDDYYSQYLQQCWRLEGINTDNVRVVAGATPSLYLIRTDVQGERHFDYWRTATPFKQILNPGRFLQHLPERLDQYTYLYLSGISLSLLTEPDREVLLQMLVDYRLRGGVVAFDPNYRARLWETPQVALRWIEKAYGIADIVLTSLEDERALRSGSEPKEILQAILQLGPEEVVMTNGPDATLTANPQILMHPLVRVEQPVDTTAAGDAFNAGYLAARLRKLSVDEAVKNGHKLAGEVVMVRGAIVPR